MPHRCLQIIRGEHASLAAVLRSMDALVEQGPQDHAEFFDVLRGMLFYIDEFPERQHHPKESELLYPRVLRAAPHLAPVIARLEDEHLHSGSMVRELQHLLLAWELLGESRKAAFEAQRTRFLAFYREHMDLEETEILPEAERCLGDEDWKVLDRAFETNRDPLSGRYQPDPAYDRLFSRILVHSGFAALG